MPLDVKGITPFSRFRQNVKNSMIDRYKKDTDNFNLILYIVIMLYAFESDWIFCRFIFSLI